MATTTGQIQIPPTGTYLLDPDRSTVAFSTRHMFGAAAVKGTFAVASGEVVIADPPTDSSVAAEIHAASFDSGSRRRDKDVHSKRFLHVEKYPVFTFRTTEVHRRVDGTWILQGTLTARGVGAPVELTVTSATATSGTLSITASGTVDRYAHGITGAKGMAARHLSIEISATASRVPQPARQPPTTARA
jgi:polyisoprenoid-binding protein YceI